MNEIGFIKVWRDLLGWEWYKDPNTSRLFIHLLLTVNFTENKWRGVIIKRGQRVTSYRGLAKELGLSVQNIRTSCNRLKSTHEITQEPTHRYTLITVANYDKYQEKTKEVTHKVTQQLTSAQHSPNNNIRKKERKEYICIPFLEFKNINLSKEEFAKLKDKFPIDYESRIKGLSNYMESKGKTYQNHYATILNWSRKDEVNQTAAPIKSRLKEL